MKKLIATIALALLAVIAYNTSPKDMALRQTEFLDSKVLHVDETAACANLVGRPQRLLCLSDPKVVRGPWLSIYYAWGLAIKVPYEAHTKYGYWRDEINYTAGNSIMHCFPGDATSPNMDGSINTHPYKGRS